MTTMRTWVALTLSCVWVACSAETTPRTEIVVMVDSDLRAPEEIDEITLGAKRDTSGTFFVEESATVGAGDARNLPRSVTLLYTGGPLGPLRIRAEATREDDPVVSQEARVSFVRGKRKLLRMNLVRACIDPNPVCLINAVCVDGDCVDIERDDELIDWSEPDGGSLAISDAGATDAGEDAGDASSDAGMDGGDTDAGGLNDAGEDAGDASSDAPSCISMPETCNDMDDDCDENVDEGFDKTSIEHCGACNNACPTNLINGRSVCVNGMCEIECAPQTKDCDGALTPGCETNLTSPTDCGDCDVMCDNATPLCGQDQGSLLCVGSCGSSLTECDDACVDLTNDAFHCGGCDDACASQTQTSVACVGSQCAYTCNDGFDSCVDNDDSNGCETNLRSDPAHCNTCGAACTDRDNSSPRCVNGTCDIACDNGYTDCDSSIDNGCEIHTNADPDNCGSCDNECPARANATTICTSGACSFMCNAGRANCDGNATNGCEINTRTNNANCGGCAGQGGDTCDPLLERCCNGACRLLSLGC